MADSILGANLHPFPCPPVCTQLLVSRPDEENITSYLQLIEKCLTHEVRTSLELPRKVAPSLSESEPLFLMWPAGPWLAPACFSSLHLTSLGFSGCPELSFLESLYNVPSLVNNSPPTPVLLPLAPHTRSGFSCLLYFSLTALVSYDCMCIFSTTKL